MNEIQEKDIVAFKEETTSFVKHIIDDQGELFPFIIILVDGHPDVSSVGKKAALVCPIPGSALENDNTKDAFINNAMPILARKIKSQNLIPLYLCFGYEAWLRQSKLEDGKKTISENWKDLPKTECILLAYEGPEKSQLDVYDILRDGLMVREDNKLVDGIILKKREDSSADKSNYTGRFANLFSRFFMD